MYSYQMFFEMWLHQITTSQVNIFQGDMCLYF